MVSLEKDKSLNCSYSVLISTIKTCWIFECARTSLPQSGGGNQKWTSNIKLQAQITEQGAAWRTLLNSSCKNLPQ